MPHDTTHTSSKLYDTSEAIHNTETKSWHRELEQAAAKEGAGGGVEWEARVSRGKVFVYRMGQLHGLSENH